MLIGGLIMVTPQTDEYITLVNPFTALPIHIANTAKCLRFLSDPDPAAVLRNPTALYQDPEAIGIHEDTGTEIPPPLPTAYASAGLFTLADDVTAKRNTMLHSRSPEAIRQLPYKVLATDILLEGLGWIELTVQVRNRRDTGYKTVDVEVFSPEGRGIGQRRTMGAYMLLEQGAREQGLRTKTARPRQSMKGQKKLVKSRRN